MRGIRDIDGEWSAENQPSDIGCDSWVDVDADDLPDWWELSFYNNATGSVASADHDNDQLTDTEEYNEETNPANPDTDTDGAKDGAEITYGTNPLDLDSDDDQLPDGWEIDTGLDPLDSDGANGAVGDPDSDDLSNMQEWLNNTSPHNEDTDNDQLPDGWEVGNHIDPLDPEGDNGADGDPDHDDWSNILEWTYATDPNNPDTDSDGIPDGIDVRMHIDVDGDGVENYYDPNPEDYNAFTLVTNTVNLPYYHDSFADGAGIRVLAQQWDFDPQLPTNIVKIHSVILTGDVDDDFAVNDTIYCGTLANDSFSNLNVTAAITDLTCGTFTLGLYDHIMFGFTNNLVEIRGTAEYVGYTNSGLLQVDTIMPDIGLEIDDGDGNPDTRVFVVSTNSGVVTITADLDPDISESSLPSCMTLVGGQGTAKLQRTIQRTTTSKTVFTFDCCGITSSKTTTVYVCDAKISLCADEGQRSWNTSWPFFTFDVGHSWWRLDLSSETVEIVPFDLQYPFVGLNGGYWPANPDNLKPLTNYEDDGVVLIGSGHGDGYHPITGNHTWQLEFDVFLTALEYFKYRTLNPGTYNLYSRNCTTEACAVGNEASIICNFYTPWGFSDWLNQQ